ncbi:Uncharacterised protein [Yersinia kristensenii]|nr:hypothetical protein DJ57_4053 [Yersinia rochesterensis]CNH67502.1 Uncharacterised protein [Yersinia kristensenii]CRY64894.1 Uncharacterised protein [Yersinia kristensenii]
MTLLLPSPRLIAPVLSEALPSTKVSLPEPVVNVPFNIALLLIMFAAVPPNITPPLMVPLLFNVLAVVPAKLIAVAPAALILAFAPMVVAVTAPSVTRKPVPPLLVTLTLKLALERSTPPPLALIPVPAPETLISNAAGLQPVNAVLTVAIPVPVPVTLISLRPLALSANVKPARLSRAVPVTVLRMTWFNVRLTPAAFEKAAPAPFTLRIKSVKTWLLVVPAKVNPVAAPVVVIVPPTIFNSALARILTPVPPLALIVPPVLSTLTVLAVVAEIESPAVVLLMVPALVIFTDPLPESVTVIPVAFLIVPSASLRMTTLPDEAALTLIPVPAVVFSVPSEMVAAERI